MKKIFKGLLFAFVAVLGLTLAACGNTQAGHQHSVGETWKRDSATHWKECSGCEEYVDMSIHTYGEWVLSSDVCNKKRTCTVCGYVQTVTVDHTWSWTLVEGEKCLYDGVCTVCGAKDQQSKHNYVDHFCTVCEESDVVIFYLRGDMNGWLNDGFTAEYTFVVDYATFTATLEAEIDNTKGWKVANSDWSMEFNAKTIQAEDGLLVDAGNAYVAKSGKYKFTITGLDGNSPTCKIEALHSHEYTWSLQSGKTCDYEGACACGATSTKVEHTYEGIVCTGCGAVDVVTYYLKGGMNGWSDNDAYKLAFDSATMTASITVLIEAGVEFKVANSSWSFQFGSKDGQLVVNDGGSGNITVEKTGIYKLTVGALNTENHTLTMEEVEPITWYVKGGMNGWSDNDDYKLAYDAATDTATITLTIEANTEFKIADSSWANQFGQGEAGLVHNDGGSGNIKVTETASYVITITKANTPEASCTIVKAE